MIPPVLVFVLLPVPVLATIGSAQVHREVRLPLDDGRLSALALTRALLNEYGFGGDRVSFPDVAVDVSGAKGTLLLAGISASLARTTTFKKVDGGKTLLVRIDQARARSVRHKIKRRFGKVLSTLTGRDVLSRRYELRLPANCKKDDICVVGVHGVDSSGQTFAPLRAHLTRNAGGAQGAWPIRFGIFEYANDEAIDRIAEELSNRLKTQKKTHPGREFILVAHSMGGLVARYMIETGALDPGNVTMLIMVGTPNHGSRLSRLRPGVDFLQFIRDFGEKPEWLGPFMDGLGEAGWDMWPDSPFLSTLNAKPRNETVTYHLILGNKGAMSPAAMQQLRDRVMAKVKGWKKQAVYAPKIQAWLDDIHEVIDGEGDGAVSVKRGRLGGVKEVIVPLSHNRLLDAAALGKPQPVFAKIESWIRAQQK